MRSITSFWRSAESSSATSSHSGLNLAQIGGYTLAARGVTCDQSRRLGIVKQIAGRAVFHYQGVVSWLQGKVGFGHLRADDDGVGCKFENVITMESRRYAGQALAADVRGGCEDASSLLWSAFKQSGRGFGGHP